jgi:hypothetical protein
MDPRMAEPKHTDDRRVPLEQLIQLKRSERPPASFWEDFDREFHRRQLVALVSIEPWHRRAARAVAMVARRIAPVAAGTAAVAFAVLALLRVDLSNRTNGTAAASVAMADLEGKVVLLPEEAILASTALAPAPEALPAVEAFQGHVRSAPQELAAGLAPARRFVAVSAPVTLSSGDDTSAIYSARALTAGTVLRTLAGAAPESL